VRAAEQFGTRCRTSPTNNPWATIAVIYIPRKIIAPKMSDHACAIIPGLRLFRHSANNPNRAPNKVILATAPTPSYRWPIPNTSA